VPFVPVKKASKVPSTGVVAELQCGCSIAAAGRRTTCSDGSRLRTAVSTARVLQQE